MAAWEENPCLKCKDADNCSRWLTCKRKKEWVNYAWAAAGGKKTPGGIGEVREDRIRKRYCQYCGAEIPYGSRRRTYCSEECMKKARMKAKQEEVKSDDP